MSKHRDKLGPAATIAPAVGLLLFGEQALAFDNDGAPLPEPSTLALLAIGAVGVGVSRAVKRRRKD